MNKNIIKIIKRSGQSKSENLPPAAENSESKKDVKLNIPEIVNNWIGERRENSRKEKAASERAIAAWNRLPAAA